MKKPALLLACLLAAVNAVAELDCGNGNMVPSFCGVNGDAPHLSEGYDVLEHADDFCRLTCNEPHEARQRLNNAVSTVSATNNPNRFYFDPKRGRML